MQNSRDALTPEALTLLQTVEEMGSFAAAARLLGVVPSALTYRIRQIEEALDVLLFDRSSRQARATPAGQELLREGRRLLDDVEAVANRVKRVATGWEPQLTIAVDSVITPLTVMELCENFYALNPPTRIKLRDEVLSGTLQALSTGQADLAIGVAMAPDGAAGLQGAALGAIQFIFVVAPHHPLARAPEPLSDELIAQHRAVAAADTVLSGNGLTFGILSGQDVFTVASLQAKLNAQLRGLGVGFLPESMVRQHVDVGRLVVKKTCRPERVLTTSYAWRTPSASGPGRALQWWLAQLQSPATRTALLIHRGV